MRVLTGAVLAVCALVSATPEPGASLRWTCPKALGPLKFAQPTWPSPRLLPTCPRAAALTCCGAAQDDFLSRLAAVCSAQGVSDRCCSAWTALSCSACDGLLALGLRSGGVCPSLCDDALAACSADWVAVDAHSGAPSACTPDSLICPRFGDAFATGAAMCKAMGLPVDASGSESLRCYDGRASMTAVPTRVLAAIANESAALGVNADGTPAPPDASLEALVGSGLRGLLRSLGILTAAARGGGDEWSPLGAAVALGAALAAALVLRRGAGRGAVDTAAADAEGGGGRPLGRGGADTAATAYAAAGTATDAAGLAAGRAAGAPSAEFLRAARLARFGGGGGGAEQPAAAASSAGAATPSPSPLEGAAPAAAAAALHVPPQDASVGAAAEPPLE